MLADLYDQGKCPEPEYRYPPHFQEDSYHQQGEKEARQKTQDTHRTIRRLPARQLFPRLLSRLPRKLSPPKNRVSEGEKVRQSAEKKGQPATRAIGTRGSALRNSTPTHRES